MPFSSKIWYYRLQVLPVLWQSSQFLCSFEFTSVNFEICIEITGRIFRRDIFRAVLLTSLRRLLEFS